MKIDAAFCWDLNAETRCDCCAYPRPAVAFLEVYLPDQEGELTFYLCEPAADRVAALEKRVAPEEASKR